MAEGIRPSDTLGRVDNQHLFVLRRRHVIGVILHPTAACD